MTRTLKALVATALLTLCATGALAGAKAAGAVELPAPDYSADETPSCSLHPDKVAGGWTLTHDPIKAPDGPIFLQVFASDAPGAAMLFSDWLPPGASTPVLAIELTSWINWAGHPYHLGAYAQQNYCGPAAPTTTTEPTTTTTTTAPEPTTTTTAPAAVEATTTTTAPESVALGISETRATPIAVQRAPLPVTGARTTWFVTVALTAVGGGLMAVGIAHRVQRGRRFMASFDDPRIDSENVG